MNLLARVANRLGRRWGIRPFPWANPREFAAAGNDNRAIFDRIHELNYWGSDESVSGGGSTSERTSEYAAALSRLIAQRGWRSMFDAPCGDLNWIGAVIDATGVDYIGGDVSEQALAAARQRRPDADLRLFDIRSDPFPAADVWHCRDCLFHLSFEDGLAALRNFARSDVAWALLTTNTARWLRNLDIETGGWRLLDLERAPYNLPPPVLSLKDYPPDTEFPRFVSLWPREAIAEALRA